MSVVANRYCEAMFDLAVDTNIVKECYESLKIITNTFNNNSDFVEILSHPEIKLENKLDLTREVLSNIEKNTLNFLLVIIEKGRVKEINNIYDDYELMYHAYYNIQLATVYSTFSLSENQIVKLEEKLSKRLDKKVKVKNVLDNTLIGGIKIMIDNQVIDSSIQQKIVELSKELHGIQIK